MNSKRIYRKALTKEKIRTELANGRGTQFDPEALDAFLHLFDQNKLYPGRAVDLSYTVAELPDVLEEIGQEKENRDLQEE